MFNKTLSLLLLASSTLLADNLNTDLPVLWPAECQPCEPQRLETPCFETPFEAHFQNPHYKSGVFYCQEGGYLEGPDVRIQAKKFAYTKDQKGEEIYHNVYCEDDILIHFYGWLIAADKFYYDFTTNTGHAEGARTTSYPWFINAPKMDFHANGKIVTHDACITTLEGKGRENDLTLRAKNMTLYPHKALYATNVQFRTLGLPTMWIPYLRMNLSKKDRSPFAVKFGWGRFMGPHLSFLYNFLDAYNTKGFLRIDTFFNGKYFDEKFLNFESVGVGIDTVYNPPHNQRELYTRNYYVPELAIDSPFKRNRYRFQGVYADRLYSKKFSIKAQYDYVSDAQMAYSYQTRDFSLNTAGSTEMTIRHQEDGWLANLFTRVRVNDFQSINQHLPTFHYNLHPFEIPNTGIVGSSNFSAAFLNFQFSNDVTQRSGFTAARVAVSPTLYRTFTWNHIHVMPRAAYRAIYYSNSPQGGPVGQSVADIGCNVSTKFHAKSNNSKHVLEPYADYYLLTNPRVPVDRYHIFSIDDGYNALNQLRFGLKQALYYKSHWGIKEIFSADIFANAFFNTTVEPQVIPIGYLNMDYFPLPFLKGNLRSSYNLAFNQLDYLNLLVDWTFNDNFAFQWVYQRRGPYYVRKGDFYNFVLNVTRTPEEILASPLSDQRQTMIFNTFLRLNPGLQAKFEIRGGWDRPDQDTFLEYLIDAQTVVFDHLRLNFVVEKKMAAVRYYFNLNLDPTAPAITKKRKKKC
jgi:hypothetical protein